MTNRRRFVGVRKSSSGQAPVLAAVLFLLLVPTTIIIAENATVNITGSMTGNSSFQNTSAENATNSTSSPWVEMLPIINETSPLNEALLLNETNETSAENATLNITNTSSEENVTLPVNDTNTTIHENITLPEENLTAPVNDTNQTLPDVPEGPALGVALDVPDRVDRNEPFLVSAEVSNTGDLEATDVEIEWVLPDGFSIVEGDAIHHCDIPAGASCFSKLTVAASLSSDLGEREIKVMVRYHD
jgi:hypothetical protein